MNILQSFDRDSHRRSCDHRNPPTFTGSDLRLVCFWRACSQWGGRVGQRVWGHSSKAGSLWCLGSQSGPHCDLSSLETHERPIGTGGTGRHWLWENIWRVEVGRLQWFLSQLGFFFSFFFLQSCSPVLFFLRDRSLPNLKMTSLYVFVFQSRVPNEQVIPLLSLLWSLHLSSCHDWRCCKSHPGWS